MNRIHLRLAPVRLASIGCAAAFALSACGLTDGTETQSEPELGRALTTAEFKVTSDKIILPAGAMSFKYCAGDTLKNMPFPEKDDSTAFTILGDTLTFFSNRDTLETSGAVVENLDKFIRVSGGIGLDGLWKTGPHPYRVISGTLTAEEKDLRDKELRIDNEQSRYGDSYLRFAGNRVTTYADIDYASQSVDEWKGISGPLYGEPDSALYAIDAKVVSKGLTEWKGRKTGETVRILYLANGDREYTSDVAGHAKYVFIAEPTACPDPFFPDWFLIFKQANSKMIE